MTDLDWFLLVSGLLIVAGIVVFGLACGVLVKAILDMLRM